MRPLSPKWTLCVLVAALALAATQAFADITLHAHYTLVSGDTVTRANYFSSHRTRVTAPDGREYMYEARNKRVAIIDHELKAYWEGPAAQADSIVDSLNVMRYHEVMANVTDEKRAAWVQLVASINDSIRVTKGWQDRLIADYHCTLVTVSAGPRMQNNRWMAAALSVPKYSAELERVVVASVPDVLGRAFAKMVIGAAAEVSGITLAADATYQTLTSSGHYAWETYWVESSSKIPDTAWTIPEGYRRLQWSDARKVKRR